MTAHRKPHAPRAGFHLDLSATSGADADGQATNTFTVTLTAAGEFISGEAIDLSVLSGTAVFTDSGLHHTTVTTNALGSATAALSDTVEESVTVLATLVSDVTITAQADSVFGDGADSLPPPALREAQGGHVNPAGVAGGDVHVEIAPWPGMAANDTVVLGWSGTDAQGNPGTPYEPSHRVTDNDLIAGVTFPVDADTYLAPYAGGTLTLGYTVNGAVSEETTLTVDAGTGSLAAPSVDEVVNGRIPVDVSTLTLRIPPWTGMTAGDHLAYTWLATSAEGIPAELHDGFPLIASDVGQDVIFNPDPELAVAAFDGGTAEAWYTVTPVSGGADLESDHATWPVGEEKPLPAPVIEEAAGEHLDPDTLPDTVHADLTWPGMAVNDEVTLYWQGTDENGTAGPEQVVASHRVTDNDVTTGQVRQPLATATWLTPYEGGSVAAFYSLNRADGSPTAHSENAVWQVEAEEPPVQTLFEDFEGNADTTISLNQHVTLVKSGITLTNTHSLPLTIEGADWLQSPPQITSQLLIIYYDKGIDGYGQAQFDFPMPINYIRAGITIAYGYYGMATFYNEAGIPLETINLIVHDSSGNLNWFEYTLMNGPATRMIVSNPVRGSYLCMDNIMVSNHPQRKV